MAARDLSKTFEDIDSEDFSLETSLPTDITMSPDHSEGESRNKKRHITKQLIEKKQMLHDMQLLKIELSQKKLALENMKAEYTQQIEDLEEKFHDCNHQKQILQARLESELQIQSDDACKRQDLIKRELDTLRVRQQELESANERLQEKAGDVRKSLKDLSLSEERFYQLRSVAESEMSLRDFVAVKLFEATHPLNTKIGQHQMQNKSLEEEVVILSKKTLELQKRLDEESQNHGELRVRYQKLTTEYAGIHTQVKTDNYKVENYDRVKEERDGLDSNHQESARQLIALEASFSNLQKTNDDLSRELSAAKQSIALLKQDKEYLTRQCAESTNKFQFGEEKLQKVNRQLEDAKLSREEMYEKYVESRDQYRSEYEKKLKEELEQIKTRTNAEIDRLRVSTREMFERENRNLREARDLAVSEREHAQGNEREMNTKYEQLLSEFRMLQTQSESRMSEIQNELKIKMFEGERAVMFHNETVKNLGQAEMEVEKFREKIEVLTKEYYTLQTSMEKKNVELESSVSEKNRKLETYEKLEQDLDTIVMQAAEVEDEKDAEKVLFSYGYGANVASTTKRRMQQSVHLARRVLQLEKANTSLRKDLQDQKDRCGSLVNELESTNGLLDNAQQPYSYLIDSIRTRDQQILQQSSHVNMLEEDMKKLKKEREDLARTHNQMNLDMETLLNQKEEMAVMKQVVLSLSERRLDTNRVRERDFHPSKSAASAVTVTRDRYHNDFDLCDNPNVVKPGSLHMSRSVNQRRSSSKRNKSPHETKFSKVYGIVKS